MDNTLITRDRLESLVTLCGTTAHGTIAEVGVYKGGSLKMIADNFPNSVIFGFDTFEGLPIEQWTDEEFHRPGEFDDTDIKSVYEFIDHPNVILIKGLFPDSAKNYRDQKFDFVHLDTDFFISTVKSLLWFWPRMNDGGIIVFDDYGWPNCPGVKQALEEFGHPVHETENVKYQAYIIK